MYVYRLKIKKGLKSSKPFVLIKWKYIKRKYHIGMKQISIKNMKIKTRVPNELLENQKLLHQFVSDFSYVAIRSYLNKRYLIGHIHSINYKYNIETDCQNSLYFSHINLGDVKIFYTN